MVHVRVIDVKGTRSFRCACESNLCLPPRITCDCRSDVLVSSNHLPLRLYPSKTMYYPDEDIDLFQEDYGAQRDLYDDANIYDGFAEGDPFLDGHPGLFSQTNVSRGLQC